MEQVFQRNLSELDRIFHFVEENLPSRKVGKKVSFSIKFVVEELFTNMVKYGKGSPGEITLKIRDGEGSCVVTMIEDDADRFDVTEAPEVDISQSLDERTPGGLGIYLVNKIVDSIDYHYANRRSTITFSKRME